MNDNKETKATATEQQQVDYKDMSPEQRTHITMNELISDSYKYLSKGERQISNLILNSLQIYLSKYLNNFPTCFSFLLLSV